MAADVRRFSKSMFGLCLIAGLAPTDSISADESEPDQPRPGLIAKYTSHDRQIVRIDDEIAFDWGTRSPDPRLASSPTRVHWSGSVLVRKPGKHVFWLRGTGSASLRIAGRVLIDAPLHTGSPLRSEAIDLSFGLHPIDVEYSSAPDGARIALDWESDQFPLEPISARDLVHGVDRPETVAAEVRASAMRRAEQLVRAGRCSACHDIPLDGPTLLAPSLANLRGTVHVDWLVHHLSDGAGRRAPANSGAGQMPDLALTVDEARAAAAYLWSASKKPNIRAARPGNAVQGQAHFDRLGCRACHSMNGSGNQSVFGGGDLSQIAVKRPADYFSAWFKNPAALNADHRMPVFELTAAEIADLAAFFSTAGTSASAPPTIDDSLSQKGKAIVVSKACVQCHAIPGLGRQKAKPWKRSESSGCLGEPDADRHRPGYHFDDADRQAIKTFLSELGSEPAPLADAEIGARLLEIKGCIDCHPRGSGVGLREFLPPMQSAEDPEEPPHPKLWAGLVAPSLDSIGDKLNEPWLARAIKGQAPRLRPWLAPRMPRFEHSADDERAIVQHFAVKDSIPTTAGEKRVEIPAPIALPAGYQLVSSTGFGCMSCHKIGSHEPANVELGARGTDLRFVSERMRREWFLRFTRNPSRIVPGLEMPTISVAAPGILKGDIDAQLDALWQSLNAPSFDVPSASAIAVLDAKLGERSIVLRDPIELAPGATVNRPLAVGLEHRANFLFDLERFSLRRAWVGALAQQKTRGKTWYWEPAGLPFYQPADAAKSFLVLSENDKIIEPFPDGPSSFWLDRVEHVSHGVEFGGRVHWGNGRWTPVEVRVIRAANPVSTEATSKAEVDRAIQASSYTAISIAVESVPPGSQPALRLSAPGDDRLASISGDENNQLSITGPLGPIRFESNGSWMLSSNADKQSRAALLRLAVKAGSAHGVVSIHTPSAPSAAASAEPPISLLSPQVKKFTTVPGYEATRLALDDKPMPVALAFKPNGTLAVASLKGEIFLVRDTDGDGTLDRYQPFGDHLAAPYGLAFDREDIIVCHKPEVLRLRDLDGDGRADRSEVVASGWGVTFDYHDWLVGPVRDQDGNLFVSPSCQQDERALAQAKWRGKVLKVAPNGSVSEHAAGIRFAMGLALDSAGNLFATDNQGNNNAFNELNHIRPGKHYGFWSSLEPRTPGQKTEPASIQIPHPWSRSVNGIAFVPAEAAFGPFAGHLIGADYSTRELIRLSLQPVGAAFQGCAYPFTRTTADQIRRDETFLGPVGLAFAPDGSLYIGSIIDSGWGGGNNRGAIERVRFTGPNPFGIREVRAHASGFDIDFTAAADQQLASRPSNYTISCYRRIPKGSYDTPDQDRTVVKVEQVDVAPGAKSVRLKCEPMRPGFVYDVAIGSIYSGSEPPFPAVAFYTLNQIPEK